MFKKMLFLFVTAVIMLSACSTLEISIDQTPTPTQAPPTLTSLPEPTTTPIATEIPAADRPTFSNVSFYRTSVRPAECGETYQRTFPARILQVHARWDYDNMRAGLLVHREWYSNGELWAKYDEPWDFVKYGAKGTVHDMPIYDFDAGLEPGNYELRLYIDGQPQFDAESKIGFVVDKDWSLEAVSPNSQLTAVISEPQKLMIRESTGTKWELARAHDIASIAWFGDGKHILYADADWSGTRNCTVIGIRYTLWIVDAADSQQHQIGADAENLHDPLLSPSGKYITAVSGSGYADGCGADMRLAWLALDSNFQQIGSFRLQDFSGIPTTPEDTVIYPVGHGRWRDATHFEIGLDWVICGDLANNPHGIYSLDMENKQATRIGDLPTP